ncbi:MULTISPECIES: S1C family serine protease [Streptomyces]|uniref:Trypsin-like peptidase domain-containing protein n=1 Tax=Streptomyces doudnae TaxID=3075536 RepID=A0ABD5EV44_9ACTN|nr:MULTISPECIES: trypsin-like peptidase domain-containing protein [unclassified Streptomyces]MDT0438578.1 trypsin-like peptidase domain-containing protein [Streptomyces sp. DSM 41981]MYQ68574.1 trypsin-like serine protease [Streptomyces sp. SID4950]SCE47281.1 putative serine protease PepD [Streptomyces sp. SolWspMP-5a-2]
MTESFRRSGEDERSQQGAEQQHSQQHASSPVHPEWPPPPAHRPAQTPGYDTAYPAAAPGQGGHPGQAAYTGQGTHPGQGAWGAQGENAQAAWGAQSENGQGAWGGQGDGGHGGGDTALLAPPAGPPARPRRTRGPLALLAAVAIVAAAVGGGTAYAFQELTGSDTVATSSTGTSVVPSSKKGDIAAVAAAVSPSIVEINATSNAGESTGSGVIITSDGEIVTNNHVVSGASTIKVRTSDGKSYTAKVVGTDSKKDLALIKLENASGLKTATLGDSAGLQVGDTVVAIGSPEGLTGTVTSGIVSALDRDVTVSTDESQSQGQSGQGGGGQWPFEFGGRQFNGDTGSSTTTYKAIQTDASLNPGNSGGALIDMNGNIIGINSAMYSASSSSSSSSSDAGSVGLGFAIPVNTVKSDLASLRAGGSDS